VLFKCDLGNDKSTTMKLLSVLFITILIFSCNQKPEKEPGSGNWIKGTEAEQIRIIEKQFRGFDNAMVETGYRYQELFWAGQDQNWEYADYQLEKIRIAVENGLERRPKRAKSAEYFLNYALPEMQKSLQKKDSVIFNEGFKALTISCNSCHAMESVPFFKVQVPTNRQSPIRK
jgi:hypothetical protein